MSTLRRVRATRYVVPLREGGSLPGIVEAEDLGTYVCKFRGAGQGPRVLVAEIVVGELARALGIATPELVAVDLEAAIARYEADEEVQDLLTASLGLNLGIDFLPGAFGFDAATAPDPVAAARILWLDAFTANVDRSWRNPNLLVWHRTLWAIDHGAALYFHHSWPGGLGSPERFAAQPYRLDDHVLVDHVAGLPAADEELAPLVTEELLSDIVGRVPEDWLGPVPDADADAVRAAYVELPAGAPAGWACVADGQDAVSAGAVSSERLGYQYVVLRCVPRADREEFVNVGLVLYCEASGFLGCAGHVDEARLAALAPGLDPASVRSALDAAEAVCQGEAHVPALRRDDRSGGTVLGARFGFLSAPRSTVVRPGPIHGGTTTDPATELARLLAVLVH